MSDAARPGVARACAPGSVRSGGTGAGTPAGCGAARARPPCSARARSARPRRGSAPPARSLGREASADPSRHDARASNAARRPGTRSCQVRAPAPLRLPHWAGAPKALVPAASTARARPRRRSRRRRAERMDLPPTRRRRAAAGRFPGQGSYPGRSSGHHARDELPAGVGERDIEPIGSAPGGVVDHAYARIGRRETLEHFSGVIGRVALGEDEFDLATLEPLGEHRGDGSLEHLCLVEDRDQDADGHGALSPVR